MDAAAAAGDVPHVDLVITFKELRQILTRQKIEIKNLCDRPVLIILNFRLNFNVFLLTSLKNSFQAAFLTLLSLNNNGIDRNLANIYYMIIIRQINLAFVKNLQKEEHR